MSDIRQKFEDMVQERRYYIELTTPGVYNLLSLSGEVGEIANYVKKIDRNRKGIITEEDRAYIVDELGDCLFYLTAYGQNWGISLDEIMEHNHNKLKDRPIRPVEEE